jgi:DNA replicative helicase MCM subunit Mcm2 (Cdc46/Mcm family)
MPETIAQVRNLLEARLREVEREARQLAESLRALDGHRPRRGRRKRRGLKATRHATKRRAPRGRRREQFLAVVKATPDATASEVAKQIGISPSQAAGVARQLVESGEILTVGKGYRLVHGRRK